MTMMVVTHEMGFAHKVAHIILFQDTSLVYVLSITVFLGAASKIAQRDGRLVEMYLFAALVYFVISFVASLLVRRLQSRIAIIR